jgi:peptidoglycan/xylan/chitin deacetylase (PgdA/CDA1 family)
VSWKVLTFLFLALILAPIKDAQAAVKIPILMYHYIGNNPNLADRLRNSLSVTPDKFDAQMQYLKQTGYSPITLEDLNKIYQNQIQPPSNPIILTFDDGYTDFYYNAYPILKKYTFKAVSFIPTGLMNQGYYLTWSQIEEMQSSGLIEFEDHTVHHASLSSLGFNQMIKEMSDSKAELESKTHQPVNFVAYPYGASNQTVQEAARKSGFIGGLGTWNGEDTGLGMNMPRIKVSGQTSLNSFISNLK